MPKIVDHDTYRVELAAEAARLFSQHGYSALGMRQIASELGISKSALYHYFPTKKELFEACTAVVTQNIADQVQKLSGTVESLSVEERLAIMRGLFERLAPGFSGEVTLMTDYLRSSTAEDIASDSSMQLANRRYKELFTALAGAENASAAYCLILGALLQNHFDGGQTQFADIEPALRLLLGPETKATA